MAEHDYRKTVRLPQTDFPMRARLPEREPEAFRADRLTALHAALRRARAGRPRFVLHDGPPYANGHIHIGHAVNKILKDFVVRSRFMMGMDAPFVPGWDCHGLPIELKVEEMLGGKDEVPPREFRDACRAYAREQIAIQREEFARLGVLGDWESPYLTMDPAFEAGTLRELGKLLFSGHLYRGAKPVHWCIRCETALAEAELEYRDHTSPSIFVKFPARRLAGPLASLDPARTSIVIWTTTPWTLPANRALAVGGDFRYGAWRIVSSENPALAPGEVVILAEELAPALFARWGVQAERAAGLDGRALAQSVFAHPWLDQEAPVWTADFVGLDAGTGVVHIAPGHGEEDYRLAKAHGVAPFCPVDAKGRFAQDTPVVGGLSLAEANDAVLEELARRGRLVERDGIRHSYPHCWRCRRPLVFRATPQWFVSMEHDRLRERALAEIGRVRWWPRWGEERIRAMVAERPDWCVSRQRHWGVPIAVILCADCGSHAITTEAVFARIVEAVQEQGIEGWFARAPEDFLDAGARCPDCGGRAFRKETDILDVWFDSGSTHACVLEPRADLAWPADLYLEGSDQHRGWFQSSLLEAVATRGQAPYRGVLTHGFVVDEKGEKMSKSRGNVVAPQEVIARYGAEVLRIWVAASDYAGDLRISESILNQQAEAYRRIRNTLRFLLGNLADFAPEAHHLAPEARTGPERWITARLGGIAAEVRRAYEDFNFSRAFYLLHQFCAVDLSGFYLDIRKDALYCDAGDAPRRRAAQSALWDLAEHLVRLLAPILPFTSDEAWRHLPGRPCESVHLAEFLPPPEVSVDEEAWRRFFALRDEVNAALDAARKEGTVKSGLEAEVVLPLAAEEMQALSERLGEELATLLNVAAVQAGEAPAVKPARGVKCPRCWIVRMPAHPDDPEHPELCPRCWRALFGRG